MVCGGTGVQNVDQVNCCSLENKQNDCIQEKVSCVSVLTDTWKQTFVLMNGTIYESAVH